MEQLNFTDTAVRGLMHAALLHVSNVSGGRHICRSDAAAFLQQSTLDELATAFQCSESLRLRLFWQEFSVLSVEVQERVLSLAITYLAVEGGLLVRRDELSAEGAGVEEPASQQASSAAEVSRPSGGGAEPDIFKFMGVFLVLSVGGVFLFGSRRAGLITEGVFKFLVAGGILISAATIWRLGAVLFHSGIRKPSDFYAFLFRSAIYTIPGRTIPASVGAGAQPTEAVEGDGVAVGDGKSDDSPFYERAAGAFGGVVLGILTLRAEEGGADTSHAITELAAAHYLDSVTPEEIIWDMMPVGLDERLNVLSGRCASILSRFDEGALGEVVLRIKEGGACRESFFGTFRARAAELR